MKDRILAKTKYNKDYWLYFMSGYNLGKVKNDIQVVLVDKFRTLLDSAICHEGSFGEKDGLWEVRSHSLPSGSDVIGDLTWKEVERYFDKTIRQRKI